MRFKVINSVKLASLLLFITFDSDFHLVSARDNATSSSSPSCRSIFNKPATCMSLKKCHRFVKLLKEHPLRGGIVIFRSLCLASPGNLIVCCPKSKGHHHHHSAKATSGSSEGTTYKPLSAPQCGLSNAPHDRVVGGNPSAVGAWPWIANIGYGKQGSRRVSFRCGGTLISPRHVVTAAHCIHGMAKDVRIVRLGEHDLQSDKDGANPIDVRIEKATIHPDYNPTSMENDIAMLRLRKDVEFTDAIHPICLPITDSIKSRDFVRTFPFVAGWGTTSFQGSPSAVLREAQLPVVDNNVCKRAYENVKNSVIDDRVLCAGYAQGGKDACQGDSGGPLMFPQKTTYYLIGVVSGGYKCAEPGYPGIYTRVTSFLDFIQDNMK